MPINMPKNKGGSGLLGAIGKMAGVASGNPMAIAGAIAPGGSPLGQAVGLYNQGSKVGDMFSPAPTPASGGDTQADIDKFQGAGKDENANPAPPDDPIARALEAKNNSPEMLVHHGLGAVDDPSLPLSYEDRMTFLEPILRAKHYGPGGGLS